MEKSHNHGRRRVLWWMLGLSAVLFGAAVWFVLANSFSLELTLNGAQTVRLEYGEPYREPGAAVVFRGRLLWKEGIVPGNLVIQTQTDLNEEQLGRYEIRYAAEYYGFRAEARREVRIVDTKPPVITLAPDPEGTPEPDAVYEEAGFSAWDNYDGDLTDRVVREETPGQVTYAVTDSSGNPTIITRSIPFRDTVEPAIALEGGSNYSIPFGTHYQEPGYYAFDNVDGDLTEQVLVEGEVDRLRAGVYPITYTVSDQKGNTAVETRNVEVVAQYPPDTCYPEGKVVYLTFDDGPSAHTPKLLEVLERYNAKATFFVVGSANTELMKRITQAGHSIGIHSVSHEYDQIYASPEAYFADLEQMQQIIYENTGIWTTMMRFPGGSSNLVSRRSCKGIMTFLTGAVQAAGYQYFDWNVYSGDAGDTKETKQVVQNVIEGIQQQQVSIVLQHDIHKYSVDAVEEILRWGEQNGYRFLSLSPDSPGFHHDLNN